MNTPWKYYATRKTTSYKQAISCKRKKRVNRDISKTRKYSKTCVKRRLSKRQKIVFQDLFSLNAGQKYWQQQDSSI